MPQRFLHELHQLGLWALALYEPVAFYLVAGLTSGMSAAHLTGAVEWWQSWAWWQAMAGYGVGVVVDLVARSRAYAKLPDDQRKSRAREWKERLLWGAVGLGFGWTLAVMLNGYMSVRHPLMADHAAPFINMMCVIIAIPLIDLSRGTMRILAGASTQQAFAGLVVGWARAATRRETPPQQAGGGDDQPRS